MTTQITPLLRGKITVRILSVLALLGAVMSVTNFFLYEKVVCMVTAETMGSHPHYYKLVFFTPAPAMPLVGLLALVPFILLVLYAFHLYRCRKPAILFIVLFALLPLQTILRAADVDDSMFYLYSVRGALLRR